FTDHKQRTGPDIVCSMDEAECSTLIKSSTEIWQMRGGVKAPSVEEQVTIDFAFATVCTISSVKKGEKFTEENIWVKRPGTGEILAEEFDSILDKIAARDIAVDEQLKLEDIL
uniref:SAF domain-containing protein n=1 Tax=uncultured Salegentibacter sp. TaxID=259320 RepID=UPI0030DDCB21